MTNWGRLLLSLLLLTATVAGASSAQRQWWGLCDLDSTLTQLAEQRQREEQLKRRHEIVHRRMNAKLQILGLLVAGKMSLLEAAARFGYLNDTPEDCPDPYRDIWAGHSDGEKLCRQVIGWVERSRPLPHSEETRQVLARLEGQLLEHLSANGGVVVLPQE